VAGACTTLAVMIFSVIQKSSLPYKIVFSVVQEPSLTYTSLLSRTQVFSLVRKLTKGVLCFSHLSLSLFLYLINSTRHSTIFTRRCLDFSETRDVLTRRARHVMDGLSDVDEETSLDSKGQTSHGWAA
jgi:hypothetical protein